MKPIIIVMLCVQVMMILVIAYAVAVRKPTTAKPTPIWSSFAVSLFVVGMVSIQIADSHEGRAGADIVNFGGAILMGMGLMCLLLSTRLTLDRHRVA